MGRSQSNATSCRNPMPPQTGRLRIAQLFVRLSLAQTCSCMHGLYVLLQTYLHVRRPQQLSKHRVCPQPSSLKHCQRMGPQLQRAGMKAPFRDKHKCKYGDQANSRLQIHLHCLLTGTTLVHCAGTRSHILAARLYIYIYINI